MARKVGLATVEKNNPADVDAPKVQSAVPESVPTRSARELPYQNFSNTATVPAMKAALQQLRTGNLYQTAMMIDEMWRDDRIAACLQTRVGALPALPFCMKPSEVDKSNKVAQLIERMWQLMFPDPEVAKLHSWGLTLGLGFGELVWQNVTVDGRTLWLPRLNVWHPRNFWFNFATRSWWVTTMGGIEEIQLGTGKWIVYAPWGVKDGYQRGIVNALGVPWLSRQWALRDLARWSEKYGVAIIKAKAPMGSEKATRQKFLKEASSLASDSTILLPQAARPEESFDIELVESSSSSPDGIKAQIEIQNDDISIVILGQNLTTEVKGGSFAAAKIHSKVRADLMQADAELLSACLHTDALRPIASFNFGNPDLAPVPAWDVEAYADKTAMGVSMENIGKGIAALRAAGVHPDADAICEEAKIPVSEPAEEPEGVEPPEPATEEPVEEDQADEEVAASRASLASPKVRNMKELVEGQLYVDELSKRGAARMADAGKHSVQELSRIIDNAVDFDDMKAQILVAYGKLNDEDLAELLASGMILAELNGRLTAQNETED